MTASNLINGTNIAPVNPHFIPPAAPGASPFASPNATKTYGMGTSFTSLLTFLPFGTLALMNNLVGILGGLFLTSMQPPGTPFSGSAAKLCSFRHFNGLRCTEKTGSLATDAAVPDGASTNASVSNYVIMC